MKLKRRLVSMTLAMTAVVAITATIATSINQQNAAATLMTLNRSVSDDTTKIPVTFHVAKNSGIPFGGIEVVDWVIRNEAGEEVAIIDDIEQDGKTNGLSVLPLAPGKYTAELRNSLRNPEHYIVPPTITFDTDDGEVDLSFQPVLWDAPETPENRSWAKNDVIYNYKFNDIDGHGFSFQRNKASEKLTILFFFKTTCQYSRRTLTKLTQALQTNGWENKVNVIAISSKDDEADLRRFAPGYSSSIRYVTVPNDDLKNSFVSYSGYPAIAYVDYQGVLDATSNGEVSQKEIANYIKTYSKPQFLDQDVTNITQPSDAFIDVHQPEIDIHGNVLHQDEPYLDLPAPNTLPERLEDLRKTKPSAIASVSKYDSRQYGIVTPIKNQGSEGLCWSYATAAASETSILREGLAPIKSNPRELIDISEHNIDFTTLSRNSDFDLLNLNPRDTWSGKKGTGNIVLTATDSLAMWNSPIDSNTKGNNYVYQPADFFLEDTVRIGNTKDLIDQVGLNQAVQQIKEMIARYGAVTASYTCAGTLPYTNTASRPLNGGHAVTIVGWDDSISQDNYHPRATRNGGWICKNSWGGPENSLPNKYGYFYMSYDSEISDMTAFNYDKAHDKYDNNYYYDARTTNPGRPETANSRPAAAIFKTQKANFETKEMLTAINVGFEGRDVTVTAKVYKDVDADFDHPSSSLNNPVVGAPVATVKKYFPYGGGYKTLELYEPIELAQNETFSIVVELSSSDPNANLFYGADVSNDNMTFYQDRHGTWKNPMDELQGSAARIKAFTKEIKIANANSNDLKDAEIKISSNAYRYGDILKPQVEYVMIGKKSLSFDDYDVIYNTPTYFKTGDQTSKDNEVIGRGTITVKGRGNYTGEKTLKYDIIVGLTPDMQGKGWYTKDGYDRPIVANFRVKKSATKYRDIEIPDGFEWNGNPDSAINFTNPLTLEYKAPDRVHYRFKSFFAPLYINLIKMNSDDFDIIPNEYNPNIIKPDTSEIPTDNPMYGDPGFDVNNLTVKLAKTEYIYEGQPITPKIVEIIAPDGAHPIIDWNFDIQYKNNNAPGIGKIIIKPKPDVLYWGEKVIEFTILNEDGSIPTVNPDAPVTNENLKSVSISLNKQIYNIDSTIIADAHVEGKELNHVKYRWEIVDGDMNFHKIIKVINVNSPHISLNVDRHYIGKSLKVVATSQDEEVQSIVDLNISPTLLPHEPDTIRPTPSQPSIGNINIKFDQDHYEVGQMVNADAIINTADTADVSYQWEIPGVKTFSTNDAHISFMADNSMLNKTLKVTITTNGVSVQHEVPLKIVAKPQLSSVIITLDKLAYQAGQKVVASANVNPVNINNVTYQWEIVGGSQFPENSPQLNFIAQPEMDNATLKVTATADGVSVSHEVVLDVSEPVTPSVPTPIVPQDTNLSHAHVTLDSEQYQYTGVALQPSVKVTLNGRNLTLNEDYTVTYRDNLHVGRATININGKGHYQGSLIKTFDITKAINTISNFSIVNNAPVANARFGTVMFMYYEDAQCLQPVPGNAPSATKTYWVKAVSSSSNDYESQEQGPIAFTYQLPEALKHDLAHATIEVLDPELDYNGQWLQPRIRVSYQGHTLIANQDYRISYTNNQLPGIGQITISAFAHADYYGSKTAFFTIKKIANTITNFHMEGNTPVATALDGGVSFLYYTDPLCQHAISADAVNEQRPYWVKAVSQETLTHYSVTTSEAIRFDYREGNDYTKSNLADADIYFLNDMVVYNHGQALEPDFEVYVNGTLLVPGQDFDFAYQNNINAGTGQLVLTAKDQSAYYGSFTTSFEIDKAINSLSPITTSNGYPECSAVYGAVTFTYYQDAACEQYVSDTLPTKAGDYWVVAHSMETNNYYGQDSLPFFFHVDHHMVKTEISQAHVTLVQTDFVFDGSYHTPSVTVTLDGKTLTPSVDYQVSYFNHQNAGTASYVVMGINQYSGRIVGNFTIHKADNNIADIKIVNGRPQITTNEHSPVEITYYKDAALTQRIVGYPQEAGYYYMLASVKETANYHASTFKKQVYLNNAQQLVDVMDKPSTTISHSSLIFFVVIIVVGLILVATLLALIVKKNKNRRTRRW